MPAPSLIFSFGKLLFSLCGKLAMSLDCCYIRCGINPDTGATCCIPKRLLIAFTELGITPPCCIVGLSLVVVYDFTLGYWYGTIASGTCDGDTLYVKLECDESEVPSKLALSVSCDGVHYIGYAVTITKCMECEDQTFAASGNILGSSAPGDCCPSGTAAHFDITGPAA